MTDIARPHVIQPPAKRGLSRTEAAGYIGVGATLFDRLVAAGEMPRPKRIGVRNIWDRCALDVAFESLSTDADDVDSNDWD